MSSIEIKDTGPIRFLRIPVDSPGVVCLAGGNGSGKSTALSAVQSLITGEGKPPVRRGSNGSEVVGLGARLTVSASNGRKGHYGEFTVANLEGEYSLIDFVSPGVKDEQVADSRRIKSLVKMFGVDADKSLFVTLFSSLQEFDSVVQADTSSVACPVEMAARIKRDVEAAARNCELLCQEKKAKHDGLMASLPASFEGDAGQFGSIEELEAQLSVFQEEAAQARMNKKVAEAAIQERERSKLLLESIELVNVADIAEAGHVAAESVSAGELEINRLGDLLEAEKIAQSARVQKLASLREGYETGRQQNDQSAALMMKMSEGLPTGPSDAEIVIMDARCQEVMSSISAKKLDDSMVANAEAAKRLLFESEELGLNGQRLRKIAQSVEQRLVSLVNESGCGMSVEDGRIVLDVGDGKEFLSDLSEGEKFRVGIKVLMAAMKSRFPGQIPLTVIPQEAYEVLQPSVRREIAEIARAEGIVVVTALPTDDEEIVVSSDVG